MEIPPSHRPVAHQTNVHSICHDPRSLNTGKPHPSNLARESQPDISTGGVEGSLGRKDINVSTPKRTKPWEGFGSAAVATSVPLLLRARPTPGRQTIGEAEAQTDGSHEGQCSRQCQSKRSLPGVASWLFFTQVGIRPRGLFCSSDIGPVSCGHNKDRNAQQGRVAGYMALESLIVVFILTILFVYRQTSSRSM